MLGQPLGFVVDRVFEAWSASPMPAHIEDVGELRSTMNTEMLSGLIKNVAVTR